MPRGPKTKLTPEVQKKIVEAITLGNYTEVAAQYAGIDPTTFYRWLEKGKQDDADPVYKDFVEAVNNAKATAEVRAVVLINRAANEGVWQAAAWFLERTRPKRYGRFDRNEVSGPDGGPMRIDVSTEDLERKVTAILTKRGEE
jgi:transposase-like protein